MLDPPPLQVAVFALASLYEFDDKDNTAKVKTSKFCRR
jgi:hypothetical protein